MKDQVVLITGAAGGLGRALCLRVGEAGGMVMALDADGEALVALEAEMNMLGFSIGIHLADITNSWACQEGVKAAIDEFGRLDVLINNAGITQLSPFRYSDEIRFRQVMEVNFFGAVHITRAALPALLRSRGKILVISSVAGFAPLYGRTAYAASKHALHGFFHSLRSELQDDGIFVGLFCPATMHTGIRQAELQRRGLGKLTQTQQVGQVSEPLEVARQALRVLQRRKPWYISGRTGKLAFWVYRLWPRLYYKLMRQQAKGAVDSLLQQSIIA